MKTAWLLMSSLLVSGACVAVAACSSDDRAAYTPELPDAAMPEASLPDVAIADAADEAVPLADEPVVCDAAPCAVQIASGSHHVCARMSDGSVRCWGDRSLGALGVAPPDAGDAGGTQAIVPALDVSDATQISAAGNTTCALVQGGAVKCWGANDQAQLGLSVDAAAPDNDAHPHATTVTLPEPATRIDVFVQGACAILASGRAACWGYEASALGLLGRTDAGDGYHGPGIADRLTTPTRVTADDYSRFALTKEGTLLTWGNVVARLSSLSVSPDPTPIPALSNVTDVAAEPTHDCALAGGEIYCWARTDYFIPMLCTGVPDRTSLLPVRAPVFDVGPGVRPQRVAVGATATCARLTDGTVQCCGDDSRGQMGTGALSHSVYALRPATALKEHTVQVTLTEKSACALTRDGRVMCWGANESGELGQGTRDGDPHPTPVAVVF